MEDVLYNREEQDVSPFAEELLAWIDADAVTHLDSDWLPTGYVMADEDELPF